MRGPTRGPGSLAALPAPRAAEPLALYGLAEIAELVNYPRTNTVRLRRMLPPPDVVLRMGPIWFGPTVQAWLERYPKARQA